MIIPFPPFGLALTGKRPSPKGTYRPTSKKMSFRPSPKKSIRSAPKRVKNNNTNIPNPFLTFINGLNSSLSKIAAKKPLKEDYASIIKGYLPENARVLTPQYPVHTKNIQFADLDGDLKNELITSYKLNDEITTMILKKQDSRWEKTAEIKNSNYDSINFIGFADLEGASRKQILVGYNNKSGFGELHGYSLNNGTANKLFIEDYNRIEVLEQPGSRDSVKAQLAIWNSNSTNNHDIDVKHWNGADLEPIKDQSAYYRRNVLPYYARKVKQMPRDPANWYNLAKVLSTSGMHNDGIQAAEFGLSQNPLSPSREDFLALKEEILLHKKSRMER